MHDRWDDWKSRGLAKDLLTLHETGAITLSPFNFDAIRKALAQKAKLSDRQTAAIARIFWNAPRWCMDKLPAPSEPPMAAADRYARCLLGIFKEKKRRKKGDPKETKEKIPRGFEAFGECPICQIGAPFEAWTKKGTVFFYCHNSRCVSKFQPFDKAKDY